MRSSVLSLVFVGSASLLIACGDDSTTAVLDSSVDDTSSSSDTGVKPDTSTTKDSSVADSSGGQDSSSDDANASDASSDASSVVDAADAGCKVPTDCPLNMACDTMTGACVTACSQQQLCNGGCCDTNGNKCVTGVIVQACGGNGQACAQCKKIQKCTNGACM